MNRLLPVRGPRVTDPLREAAQPLAPPAGGLKGDNVEAHARWEQWKGLCWLMQGAEHREVVEMGCMWWGIACKGWKSVSSFF